MTTATDTDAEVRAILTEKQSLWLEGLHEVYVFLSAHPELIPSGLGVSIIDYTGGGAYAERARAAKWVKALGSCDKKFSDELMTITSKQGRFGPHKVGYSTWRESVCTKTVTTTEREELVPDPDVVAKAPLVKRTVIDEIVEWDCTDALLAS